MPQKKMRISIHSYSIADSDDSSASKPNDDLDGLLDRDLWGDADVFAQFDRELKKTSQGDTVGLPGQYSSTESSNHSRVQVYNPTWPEPSCSSHD
jgi:hypothetical protein